MAGATRKATPLAASARPTTKRVPSGILRAPAVVVTAGGAPYNRQQMPVTASLPEVSKCRPLIRIVFLVGLLLLLPILGVAAWLYSIARSPLPQLDGSVAVPGLSAKVRVVRDGHGFPSIEASSLDDLFFAQGYVTAQDRLWQMDVMRRGAGGELAEILGPDLLKVDLQQRTLGLR